MVPSKPKIAFAGLGAMGYGMATHLVRSGYLVTGHDVYEPIMAKFVKENRPVGDVRSDQKPAGAVKDAEVLIIMVANSIQATALLFDPDIGAVRALGQGVTIMMCSTVAPAYIFEVEARLKEMDRPDVKLIDCPVSGGSIRAAEGKLSIFSSGSDSDLTYVEGILECLSARLYKIPGGLGGGSKAKLIHQIFAGVNIAMFSEAMALAAVAGFDTKHVYETLKKSEASSWMFEQRVPYLLREKQGPYSAVTIIAKDVGIITSTARASRFPLPLLSTAEQLYLSAVSAGWGPEDDRVISRLYLPPQQPNLVSQQVGNPRPSSPFLSVSTIQDLMIGVHLAATAEAMSFCEHLGIDTDLMYDIVLNAAGGSRVFGKYFMQLKENGWSLKGTEGVRDKLSTAIDAVYVLKYPLYLSSAALQEFQRQLK